MNLKTLCWAKETQAKKKKNILYDPIYMKFNHKQSSSVLTEAIMVGTWQSVGTDWWGGGEVSGETISSSEYYVHYSHGAFLRFKQFLYLHLK